MSGVPITVSVQLALQLIDAGLRASQMIGLMHAEGRGDLTAPELAELRARSSTVDARLEAEIAKAESEGR